MIDLDFIELMLWAIAIGGMYYRQNTKKESKKKINYEQIFKDNIQGRV